MIFTAAALAQATGGELVRSGEAGLIDTDSRRLRRGSWFVALTGARFDGHTYLPHADAAGCAGCIAQRVPEGWSRGFIRVPDTLLALQDIARYARAGFDGPVVGITGSAGKTTTRAMTGLTLSSLGPVHQTAGNLNNHIGLPLTLLAAPADAAAWVIEMGMNHRGEIDLLQDISRPTIRLITNVGAAHTEGVGGIEGVAQAKGELFDGARPGDVCIINHDDPHVRALPLPEGVRIIRFGTTADCDVQLTAAAVDPDTLHTRFRVQTPTGVVLSEIRSPGTHLAMNAAAAIAVGEALRCPTKAMAHAISQYEPVGARQRIVAIDGGPVVLNDAYNANPLSTAASLRTLAAITGRRRVALLGDMLELGDLEASGHAEMLDLAQNLSLDLIGLAGPRYAAAWQAAGAPDTVLSAPDALSLAAQISDQIGPGDVVLLKGSRGIAMERLLDTLNPLR